MVRDDVSSLFSTGMVRCYIRARANCIDNAVMVAGVSNICMDPDSHLNLHNVPFLVAHRGYPAQFPENSLEGIAAALAAGACFVEFDVQLSGDGIPVVIHDQNLLRTAGIDVEVSDTRFAELKQHKIGEPERFAGRFADAKLPSLQDMAGLILQWPESRAFVEIKRSSLRRFGRRAVLSAVLNAIQPVLEQCIVISFDRKIIQLTRDLGVCSTGWVAERFDEKMYESATELSPDFMFFDIGILPPASSREPGSSAWDWVVYTIDDPGQALHLGMRGIRYVETDAIGEMLLDPLLKQKRCYG